MCGSPRSNRVTGANGDRDRRHRSAASALSLEILVVLGRSADRVPLPKARARASDVFQLRPSMAGLHTSIESPYPETCNFGLRQRLPWRGLRVGILQAAKISPVQRIPEPRVWPLNDVAKAGQVGVPTRRSFGCRHHAAFTLVAFGIAHNPFRTWGSSCHHMRTYKC